ncbi:unnamed protein product, partial [Ectocarpus sp. 4 AP-2014]
AGAHVCCSGDGRPPAGGVDGFWIGQRSHGGCVPEPGEADPQKTQPAIGGQVQHRIAALCVSLHDRAGYLLPNAGRKGLPKAVGVSVPGGNPPGIRGGAAAGLRGGLAQQGKQEGHQAAVETAARPYAFIKFDKVIQRKRKEFLDPQSRNNMARLNDDLADIHSIMKQNIEEVLNRGEKLDHVSEISKTLSTQAEQFKWSSKKLSLMALWQKYGPIGAMVIAILFILWWKFF